MEKEKFALLKSEILLQEKEIEKIYRRLEERRNEKGKGSLESIGYQLHNLYCAFEDLLKIVAGFFENTIQDNTRFHVELLKRMTISIEGIRPHLITGEIFPLLDNLRAFRHFFRHAYGYELDPRKLSIALEDALKLRVLYPRGIQQFLNALA